MDERIKKVMAAVFQVDVSKINEESSADNIGNWDSLKHINLVIALEREFKIEFDDRDAMKMLNYKLIKFMIKEKYPE